MQILYLDFTIYFFIKLPSKMYSTRHNLSIGKVECASYSCYVYVAYTDRYIPGGTRTCTLRLGPGKYLRWNISLPVRRNRPRSPCTRAWPSSMYRFLSSPLSPLRSSILCGTRIPPPLRTRSVYTTRRSDRIVDRPPSAVLCTVVHIRLRLYTKKKAFVK